MDKAHVFVKGGDIAAAAAMRTTVQKEGTMDADVYRQWAQSIINNPALIHSEVENSLCNDLDLVSDPQGCIKATS